MNKDVRKKERPEFRVTSKFVREQMLALLKLIDELETAYQTYPRLRGVVGHEAWQQLTDIVYRQLLDLNLKPKSRNLRDEISANLTQLEDLAASTLIRDRTGLRDTASRVLRFRLQNGLVAR